MAMPMADKEYMAECDLKTLIEAAKIKKDQKRFSAVKRKHKEMMAAMTAAGLHGDEKSKG